MTEPHALEHIVREFVASMQAVGLTTMEQYPRLYRVYLDGVKVLQRVDRRRNKRT